MRAIRALQTSAIAVLLCAASAFIAATAHAEASSQCDDNYHKHHHNDDDEVDYNRPHIHAKPDRYVRPYSSGQGIRNDFDPYNVYRRDDSEYDPDYDDNRNMYDSDEPYEE